MQPTTSAQALTNLQKFQSGMKNPADILTSQEQNLGVPQQQQQVSGLRQAITNTTNLLNQVAPSVEGRTANSLVTSGQANRMIQNEQAPISSTLSKQTSDYNTANSDYDRLLQQAQAQTNADVTGQNEKLSALQSIYGNLFQQEQAKQAAAQAAAAQKLEQQKLAEQIREANMSNASSSTPADLLSSILSANTAPSAPRVQSTPQVDQNKAKSDVLNLLDSGNQSWILKNYTGIQKSAANGNATDKYKLKLIQSIPEFQKYLISNFSQLSF